MEGPPFSGNKSLKNDNDKLQYGNIKERLNLHVKKRLNVQPQCIVHNNTESNPLVSGTLEKNITAFQSIHKFPKATKRPYTKRKDKTCSPIASNNFKLFSKDSVDTPCPVKFVVDKNILDGAVPVVASRKYNKRRHLPPAENTVTFNEGGIGVGGGDEDSQDVEARGRHNDKDKSLDILSAVLNLKKRSLMQCPEVLEIIKTLANAYRN